MTLVLHGSHCGRLMSLVVLSNCSLDTCSNQSCYKYSSSTNVTSACAALSWHQMQSASSNCADTATSAAADTALLLS
eukprot:9939-Heterococcus_DN1.PRE.4